MGFLREHMIQEMTLQGYSQASIQMYVSYVYKYARFYNKKPTETTQQELRNFFFHLINSGKSYALLHCYYNALLYFFSLHKMKNHIESIPRPKKIFKVPIVLSKTEIQTFLDSCIDLRHKTLFTILYSAGLRISEALNLKISDLDFDRKMIFISESKNRKERYAILGNNTIKLLQKYIVGYAPEDYLFFNLKNKYKPMKSRYVQHLFQKYISQTNIHKPAHVHTLRHSFATHLLEENVNIFYIMKLLGHSSIQSTMIYLHAQQLETLDIQSPIDTMDIAIPVNVDRQLELQLAS